MSKDTTLGISPQKLARLLDITLDSESNEKTTNSVNSASQLIQAHLSGTLPFDDTLIDELPAIIGLLRKKFMPHEGRSIGNMLMDAKSDLEAIKEIRRYAKRLTSRKYSEARHAVAIAIYFAAIASALIFHNVKITTHSYESLKTSFENLAEKSWMPTDLVGLFRKAHRACQDTEP